MTGLPRSRMIHGGNALPWFTLTACALLIAIQVTFGPAQEALIFNRKAIEAGEVWRLMTGHLVHTGNRHLAWNVAALFVIGGLLEWEFGLRAVRHLAVLTAGAVAISAWLWWGMPSLEQYSGFSGILNTQLVIFLAEAWRKTRNRLFVAVGVGAAAKIFAELLAEQSFVAATTWPSVPEAHGIGLLAGIALLLLAGLSRLPGRRSAGRAMREVSTYVETSLGYDLKQPTSSQRSRRETGN